LMWIDISNISFMCSVKKKESLMNEFVQKIFQGIVDGQQVLVAETVEAALQAGVPARTILDEGMLAAMAEVGRQFEENECYVPEMLISARAMKAGLAKLQPSLKQTDVRVAGQVAIGTVKGDLHDMGKNLVGMMLEGAGFTVKDLGVDVSPEAFVAAADEVDVIGLSALLTTTMGHMKNTLDALDAAGKRPKVKVIVGGAPVTEDFARIIGADGYAPDASRAVALAKSLISSSN
jgi:5-methyltetrahydrofolate--homocysteine methyltransferase